jgi:hypothetical protein|tara:strand:+ start:3555 stop:5543 length:1989 start_codon:yes stop_codon:yes gene_type:complete
MGGVAGHMDHLYDNRDLSFNEMKEIMAAASDADLKTEEKVDGQNLFLSYSIPEGKAKGARNKGNLRAGGLDAPGLATKFAGRGFLESAFNGGFNAFEKAVESLSDKEKMSIFGPDADIWYNAEIMDPGARNVINYDGKTLKIHNVGHFVFDKETAERSPIPEGSLGTLDSAVDRMQDSLSTHEFSIAREALINLQKLEDKAPLQLAESRIDKALRDEGLDSSSTVGEYLFSRVVNGIDNSFSLEMRKNIARYLLKLPGNIGKRALKQGLSKDDAQDLDSVIATSKSILQQAIYPIEMAVHDFTVEILKGLESVFIADNKKEVQRLKKELSTAVKQITDNGPENPQAMEVMQRHLNKIKDFSQITTPIEAVVFDYNGHTYKFAGNFAPLNQILGLFRYQKGPKGVTKESLTSSAQVLTEKDGKKIALLPGGFKPPHAGHYGLAKLLASEPNIDEVVVIIGKKPRMSQEEPKVIITANQSKNLWDLYTKDDPNIKVRIQQGKTPVADVYDLIGDKNEFSEGDTVILGKSDKDVGDKRYARAQSWAEMHNPGVTVEEMVFPVIGGSNMGGTALRDMVATGNKDMFMSKLPEHLSETEREDVWNLVTSNSNESLDRMIDSSLDEISAMSGGGVGGYASPFGRTNKTNVYRQTKKPRIKKAKRQRRR